MALEDAVTLGEAMRVHGNDVAAAFEHYQRSRVARTARVVLSAREMGRIFHASGVERLVRNDLWTGSHARALLRRARVALRLARRALPRRLSRREPTRESPASAAEAARRAARHNPCEPRDPRDGDHRPCTADTSSPRSPSRSALATPAFAADPLKIGLVLPMTGPFADYGKQIEHGIRLYLAANGDTFGGRKVELIIKDDSPGTAGDVEQAARAGARRQGQGRHPRRLRPHAGGARGRADRQPRRRSRWS